MPSPSRRLRTVAFLASGLVLAVAAIGYFTGGHRAAAPAPPPPGCQAGSGVAALPLDTSQAAIAATIAGVAARHGLGKQAVTIAYATALQESKLQNLDYGDRDSVGVFQQRPSQGWGTATELQDPVYATTRFFAALVQVHGYTSMPVSQAAQDVQRSAGGYAYEQWAETASLLAGYFTGASAAGVSCWYTPSGQADLTAALKQLTSTFGPAGSHAVLTKVSTMRTASTGTAGTGTGGTGTRRRPEGPGHDRGRGARAGQGGLDRGQLAGGQRPAVRPASSTVCRLRMERRERQRGLAPGPVRAADQREYCRRLTRHEPATRHTVYAAGPGRRRSPPVTYIIAQPCVDVLDRACIEECPVDCIYEGDRMLYIHPDECVDCGACEPVCPVEAIYYEDDVPDQWKEYYKVNVDFFEELGSPGGASKTGKTGKDHPVVAALPPQAAEE